jgi:homogentisate 1,2-dioxygenase
MSEYMGLIYGKYDAKAGKTTTDTTTTTTHVTTEKQRDGGFVPWWCIVT